MEDTSKNKVFTIPNVISIIRLILVPFVIFCYAKRWFVSAFVLLILSAVSDFLDGTIARHFNQISSLGKILDPLADKLTMAATFFAIMIEHSQMRIVFISLIVKESAMILGSYLLIRMGKRPSESKVWGKLSTALLYLSLCVVVIFDVISSVSNKPFMLNNTIMIILSLVCCFSMLIALIQYYPIFLGIRSGKYNIQTEEFEGDQNK